MEKLWIVLPGAVMAGLGAVLCALGYRQVRFQAMTVGICAFAAAGAAAGSLLGFPAFAAGLCASGAVLGFALHRVLFPVYVGLAAALGGGAIGLLLAVLTHYSNPLVLCCATALGCTVVSLLDARLITIGWTSAAGAALVTHGLYRSIPYLHTVGRGPLTWTLSIIALALFAAGFAFQVRTSDEREIPTQVAPAPSA
jgi:hypothetical protein